MTTDKVPVKEQKLVVEQVPIAEDDQVPAPEEVLATDKLPIAKQNSAVVVVIIIVWKVLCISCALFRLQHNCIKSNVQKFDLDHNVIIKDAKSYF